MNPDQFPYSVLNNISDREMKLPVVVIQINRQKAPPKVMDELQVISKGYLELVGFIRG
jgi:hypothetical protein